ncbi:MAG: CatB-related O-acetyltransferase [gamma proteobacterium symbiont of Bathyaustriella thionipta]|nr:CatB-related O-acetyltransferase [gamma proteobacterium symbiont of Bathyaustriella thionipta]MCU7948672.1 CatB-related O-acetyltransferase [gamma proteobacterium symbiont of Bathyaustriella thionipta]MCU7952622.1 CatB-related O-acetyltransferase [gamma proteobacterium symbiont of Bathyaustriella thionipta]MCU7955119.1 CatB-related O-acetyltransferase [gamma proteobacterium symbiont of Bathyaustriella thionipta]MCU7968266.1 CatB-related O-acetyltransferase [gamma proteobacterium symbiont of 
MFYSLYFEKKRARKAGIKINDFRNLKKSSILHLETPVSLGDSKVIVENNLNNTLSIGRHSYIRGGEILNTSKIGRHCSIGQNVTLGLNRRAHPVDWASTSTEICHTYSAADQPLEIGHDVWIGQGAVIMSDIKIGNGAIIGCNSVVIKDVEPYQIVAGNPAKAIRYRFDEHIISALNQSNWWEFPLEVLKDCKPDNISDFIARIHELKKQEDAPIVKIIKRKVYQ